VVYKVKTKVDVVGMFSSDLKHSLKMPVLQCAAAQPLAIQEELDKPVHMCCCFNKGSVRMEAKSAANSYMPGDAVHVEVKVRASEGFAHVCGSARGKLSRSSETG
jgi:hypothetical protein